MTDRQSTEDFLNDYKPAVIMPAKKQSLYDIRVEHLQLLDEIEQNEGELTPELEQALSLTNEQFQEKSISYGFVIKKFEDNISLIDLELARLYNLKDAAIKRRDLFKQRLSDAMQAFGFEKITTPLLTLSFRKSQSVEIYDEQKVPEDYWSVKTVRNVSKELIKSDLKRGIEVPGAQFIYKDNLQIK